MNEVWRNVSGYGGVYGVSNTGSVKSFKRGNGKILGPELCNNKYFRVTLYKNMIKKRFFVHRLVALAFIPNPKNKPCVNHLSGDKLDNSVKNLSWATHSEDKLHSHRVLKNDNGYKKGENHLNAKLTEKQVLEIRKLHETGKYVYKDLAKIFKVCRQHISYIVRNKAWQHLGE